MQLLPNSSFEVDLTGYLAAGTPLRRDRTEAKAHLGIACCELETEGFAHGMTSFPSIDLDAGLKVFASAYFQGESEKLFQVHIEERNAADEVISSTPGTQVAGAGDGTWVRAVGSHQFGPEGVKVRVRARTTSSALHTWWADDVTLTVGTYVSQGGVIVPCRRLIRLDGVLVDR